jgi:hypothetical protein
MNDVSVDRLLRTVTVGAGATFDKINDVLERFQAHIPGGECTDVAVGGYMQGGGYGLTSRTFGIELRHCRQPADDAGRRHDRAGEPVAQPRSLVGGARRHRQQLSASCSA